MKVTRTTTEEIEVELKFPSYFRRSNNDFIMLLSESKGIHVWLSSICPEHNAIRYAANIGDYVTYGTEITEQEFLDAFNYVRNKFTSDVTER